MKALALFLSGFVTVAMTLGAQDSASLARADSAASRAQRARAAAVRISDRTVRLARRGAILTFDVDSTVEYWTTHDDAGSAVARRVSPIAFWVPVAAVAAQPFIWADESREGHLVNSDYARSATAALAMGFITSRTTKHFIRRERPCAREADSTGHCSLVKANASFFSEHTMAVFAIASSATFLAQRRHAKNANAIATLTFGSAGLVGIGRIYEHHHWLSDVVVGALVGAGAGWVAAQLPRVSGE
jgi:membrane-associated phospholipid phosphatase